MKSLGVLIIGKRKRYLLYQGREYYPFVVIETTKENKLPYGVYIVKVLHFNRMTPITSLVKSLGTGLLDIILSLSETSLKTQREVLPYFKEICSSKDYAQMKNILNCIAIHDYGRLLCKTEPEYHSFLSEIGIDFEKVKQKYNEIMEKRRKKHEKEISSANEERRNNDV